MNVDVILSRLRCVRPNRNGWTACCPAHADKSPSLSVREEMGKILLYCFAGCSVEAICAALGLRIRDLFIKGSPELRMVPVIVREAQNQIASLRGRVTPRERKRDVTVVLAKVDNPDPAIARALALTVEGELVQIGLKGPVL